MALIDVPRMPPSTRGGAPATAKDMADDAKNLIMTFSCKAGEEID